MFGVLCIDRTVYSQLCGQRQRKYTENTSLASAAPRVRVGARGRVELFNINFGPNSCAIVG